VTNTLAYPGAELITTVKNFIVEVPCVNVVNFFLSQMERSNKLKHLSLQTFDAWSNIWRQDQGSFPEV
jgi:hypothetical protein